jgi:hypothetical protein
VVGKPSEELLGEVSSALMSAGQQLQQDAICVQHLLLGHRKALLHSQLQLQGRRRLQSSEMVMK